MACASTDEPQAVAHDSNAHAADSPMEYGFLLRTDSGDTVAIERVRRSRTWHDAHLWLPRRDERDRFVLHNAPDGRLARWDVIRERGPRSPTAREPERWRVHAAAESLFVTQGAVIGARFSLRTLAAPGGTLPWHDASGALLEELLRRAAQASAPGRAATAATWTPAPTRSAATTANVAALPNSDVVRTVQLEPLSGDSVLLRHSTGDWRLALSRDGRLLGGVAGGRRLVLTRIPSPPDTLFDAPWRVEAAAADAPYEAEEVVLRASDGVSLAGTFTKPRGASQAPAVLLVSGAGPQDRNLSVPGLADYRLFASLADTLARRGLAVLRLDDRGTGRSGGVAFSATALEEVDDARVALAWLRARADVQADRIALVGHSDGGLTALHVAETSAPAVDARSATTDRTSVRDPLRALVLIGAPSRSGRELARMQRRSFVAADPLRFPASQQAQTLALLDDETERMARVDPWLRDWLDHDPREIAWRSSVPVLLVHGERDQQVPVVQVDELAALLQRGGARAVQSVRLPGVNHLLLADTLGDPRRYRALPSRAVSARALGPVVEWLLTRLERGA
jgi:alpha-beta hydrolase superfamily lysophospholipase